MLQSDPSDFRAVEVPGPRNFSRVVRNGIVSLHSERDEGSWIQRLRLVGSEFRAEAAERQVPESPRPPSPPSGICPMDVPAA